MCALILYINWYEDVTLLAVYMFSALVAFCGLPLSPQILDLISPLNQSRPRILPFEFECFVDLEEYYYQLLSYCYTACISLVIAVTAIDGMYVCTVQHVCCRFALVKYVWTFKTLTPTKSCFRIKSFFSC